MKIVKIECDQCRNIIHPNDFVRFLIEIDCLKCIPDKICVDTGRRGDFEGKKHFCDCKCLKKWLEEI